MTEITFTEVTMRARPFALAWRAVYQAAWRDPDSMLHDSIAVEQYDDGILLYATNAYLLLWCWVPNEPGATQPNPDDLAERPPSSEAFLVRDVSGLGKALMKWIISSTKDSPGLDVFLSLSSMENDDQPTLDPALDRVGLRLAFGDELLTVPVQDVGPPGWRSIYANLAGGKRTGKLGAGRYALDQLRRVAGVYVDEAEGVRIEPVANKEAMALLRLTYEGLPVIHGLLTVGTDGEAAAQ